VSDEKVVVLFSAKLWAVSSGLGTDWFIPVSGSIFDGAVHDTSTSHWLGSHIPSGVGRQS
jgi:hypothetical protein